MNMSYCRFENTYEDLCDCVRALNSEGLEDLSETERTFANWMYEKCKEFIETYEEQNENEE